jgi:hypothetical protein
MGSITVSTLLPASPATVWADVRHIARHVEWMEDAESIAITSAEQEGVGVAFDCLTKIGPITLTDHMIITDWVDDQIMGVKHVGLVTGTGQFTLTPTQVDGQEWTTFTWTEDLTYPIWLGGVVGGVFGDRILKQVWKRNLRNLRERF